MHLKCCFADFKPTSCTSTSCRRKIRWLIMELMEFQGKLETIIPLQGVCMNGNLSITVVYVNVGSAYSPIHLKGIHYATFTISRHIRLPHLLFPSIFYKLLGSYLPAIAVQRVNEYIYYLDSSPIRFGISLFFWKALKLLIFSILLVILVNLINFNVWDVASYCHL